LLDGSKTCEIRFNDRDYQVGDKLSFEKPNNGQKFEKFVPTRILMGVAYYIFVVTHIHSNLGMKDGYVVLSLRSIERRDHE
jgi:hypothetical protein